MLPLVLLNCNKNQQNYIPNVLVDISVNINNPGYITLTAVGGWQYFAGGSRGIIVYRRSTEEFNAFDRHCPYEPENTCGILSVQSDNVTFKCACCGSTFMLMDGSLQAGPAIQPVKRYQTTFDGTILRVFN